MTKITVRGEVDENAVGQLVRCAEAGDAPIAALSADGHYGYSLCIGGAVGYRQYVSPSGVGYDIGCGNKAVKTSLLYGDIRKDLPAIMDEVVRRVQFGTHGAVERADHEVLGRIARCEDRPVAALAQKARAQLGTVGGGNHYVDLFRERGTDRVWIGVHFGSRGFGHTIAEGFLARAAGREFGEKPPKAKGKDGKPIRESMDALPTLINVNSPLGYAYVEAMTLAGDYAYAGRDVVCDRMLDILGAESMDEIHNHHNYAWRELHDCGNGPEPLWVVRKGCTPAFPGQRGFVGATMGEPSVILVGKESEAGPDLLYSTVHGAGRLMSRNEAKGKARKRWACGNRDCEWVQGQGEHKPENGACPLCRHPKLFKRWVQISEGRIDWPEALAGLRLRGIELRGGAADEAPLAYKRLNEVLDYHADTIDIQHTLEPIGVAMAGSEVPADD